jgi:hypothetical protein
VQATVLCNATTSQLTNYQTYSYQCTVDLPPAAEWLIYYEESARPVVANITAGTLRLEATLNNLITPIGGGAARTISNNSPVFSALSLPVSFVSTHAPATASFSASDNADQLLNGQADSLVFSLDRPMNGCGSYEIYLANSVPPCTEGAPLSGAQPCIVNCNFPTGGVFTPTYPLPVSVDTVGSCPGIVRVQPLFRLNAQTGFLYFTPDYWNPNVTTNFNAGNKYVVVGKVTEYRKLNGVYYKVGSVRRDFLIIVVQGTGNVSPSNPTGAIAPALSGSTLNITRDTTSIVVRTCNYTRVNFNFTDPNNVTGVNRQALQVYTEPNLNPIDLQGGDIGSFIVQGNGTPTPRGTFYFQPSASAAGTTLTTILRIEDDACPTKGVQYLFIRIRVVQGSTARVAVSGQGKNIIDLCNSVPLTLQAQVNRPDSVRVVAANATVVQAYNYRWSVVGTGNGLPTMTNTSSIAVSPTVTTRYRVRIDPQLGFGPTGGACGDTTSILVRVVPRPATPIITRTGNVLTSSSPTGNQWYLNGQPIAGATNQTFTASASGSYTVVVTTLNGTSATGCAVSSAPLLGTQHALPGTSLSVAPNPTADGRFNVTLTGYHQAAALTLFDALGRPVRQVAISAPNPAGTTQLLNIAPLPAGLYILQVRTAGGIDTRQIVRE